MKAYCSVEIPLIWDWNILPSIDEKDARSDEAKQSQKWEEEKEFLKVNEKFEVVRARFEFILFFLFC